MLFYFTQFDKGIIELNGSFAVDIKHLPWINRFHCFDKCFYKRMIRIFKGLIGLNDMKCINIGI